MTNLIETRMLIRNSQYPFEEKNVYRHKVEKKKIICIRMHIEFVQIAFVRVFVCLVHEYVLVCIRVRPRSNEHTKRWLK